MSSPHEAPALLTMPHYGGTLAAARCLAQRGVTVVMASDRLLAPAFWSRCVRGRIKSPTLAKGPRALLRWLLHYGITTPGAVLHPTSDDFAYVIARHARELRHHFHLYTPPLETLGTILDKSALYQACVELGIPAPKTWLPRTEREVASLAESQRVLMLKPRAQMFFSGGKGQPVSGREAALTAWRSYRYGPYQPELLADFPDLELPMLQEYEPTAATGTYSISGFIDTAGQISGSRASTKVLQTSRSGTGMRFVASELDPTALGHIERLCRSIGYFGAFEIEFVRRAGTLLLIDFNPRYYGQMGFDLARGAAFPWLLHCAAQGHDLSDPARQVSPLDAPVLYEDGVALAWWRGKAVFSGAVHYRELAQLGREGSGPARRIDAAWRTDDPVPALVAMAGVVWSSVRHPGSFLRSLRNTAEVYGYLKDAAE